MLTYKELVAKWRKDGMLDPSKLDEEVSRTYNLHAEYGDLRCEAHTIRNHLKRKMEILFRDAYTFYFSPPQKRSESKFRPPGDHPGLTLLKKESEMWVKSDSKVQELQSQIDEMNVICDWLDYIMEMLTKRRGYDVATSVKLKLHKEGVL